MGSVIGLRWNFFWSMKYIYHVPTPQQRGFKRKYGNEIL